jgi:hypothetical protein
MTAGALVAALHRRGLTLRAELHLTGPQLIDADRAALRASKPAVLALLADLETLDRDGTAARLRNLAATLTPPGRERLAAEAAAGDPLAGLIWAAVAGAVTETP